MAIIRRSLPSPKNRTKYQYDANGNLVETIDANANANGGTGNVIVYTHNALNQQTGEYWYGSVTAAGTDSSRASAQTSIVYGYDEDGELVTAQDNYASPNQGQDSGYHYTYNSLGQQLSVDNNAAGYSTTAGVPRVVLSSTYDADGNRKSLSAKIGSTPTPDFVNSYQYDSSNREVQVAQVQATGGDYVEGKLGKFTYDADGETSTIDRLRGASPGTEVVTSTYQYDSFGRTTNLTHSTTPTINDAWTYDADSEVKSFTDSANPGDNFSDCAVRRRRSVEIRHGRLRAGQQYVRRQRQCHHRRRRFGECRVHRAARRRHHVHCLKRRHTVRRGGARST